MALSAEQLKARENKLTASMVKVLMTGTAEELISLWKQILGMEEGPDLSGIWPVRLGEATEALNLAWYERKHGKLKRVGEVVIGDPNWMAATLDGWDNYRKCPIECKHVGGREPLETIIARYMPQCHWQMMVTGAKECALSVIMGANEPIVEYIPYNPEYAKELMTRATAFMLCVETLNPPAALPAVEPPPLPIKEYDMTGNDTWRGLADRWIQSYGAAALAESAAKAIKTLTPADAQKAFGHGICVVRNRAGALRLTEMKDA